MGKTPQFKIAITADPKVIEKIGYLRAEVWRQERMFPDFGKAESDCWLDDEDDSATHWIVTSGDDLIAAARMTVHPKFNDIPDAKWIQAKKKEIPTPTASFNRMVVHRDYRALGIAKSLDAARLEKARQLGVKSVIVFAVGKHRLKALQDFGFKTLLELPENHGLMIPETLHTAVCLAL